jgi:hypothetical protein
MVAVGGAILLTLATQGVAAADPIAKEYCDPGDVAHFGNYGQCASAVQTFEVSNGNTDAVGICNLYFGHKSGESVPGGPYETQGECVSSLKAMGY